MFDSAGVQEVSEINIFITVNNTRHMTKCRTETRVAKQARASSREEKVRVKAGVLDRDAPTRADDVILVRSAPASSLSHMLSQVQAKCLHFCLRCHILLWDTRPDKLFSHIR